MCQECPEFDFDSSRYLVSLFVVLFYSGEPLRQNKTTNREIKQNIYASSNAGHS